MEKKVKRKNNRNQTIGKNRDIWVTCGIFVLLFLVMIGYYIYFVYVNGDSMINNSYNSRQKLLNSKNSRGTIYAADGEVLADTVIDDDGNETRIYPYQNLFAHAVGFSTRGKTGIEAEANYYLIHSNINLETKSENEVSGQKNPGDNVYTSLRTDLQQIASKSLGVSKGAIIVSNVKTGEILAMVSKPDFNPETIVRDWDKLAADEEDSALLNRAAQGIYPPGSTFKIVTTLAYLRENSNNYENYRYQCNGSLSYDNGKITCYHGTKHGSIDLTTSFAKSCNCSFANMGITLNRNIYQKTLTDLGFNQKLPVAFNYKQSKLTVDEKTLEGDMIQISFGQGSVQMTPLHLNLITNAIANGGIAMKPYLINKVVSEEGTLVKEFKPTSWKTLMTAEEADILKELMTVVVQEGTGKKLKGLSYTAAGKTGSAEYNKVKEDSHAWFTAFAPAEDPEISVTIIVEKIGSGGDYAVPIAKRIFDAYFQVN